MKVEFEDLLRSAGLNVLQKVIGEDVLDICNALSPEELRPRDIRRLVLSLKSPIQIIRSDIARQNLLLALPENAAQWLASSLGNKESDPYSFLLNHTFGKGSKSERALIDFLGLEYVESNPQYSAEAVRETSPAYGSFPHQIDLLNGFTRIRKQVRRVIIHMPTGSGKTRTAMNIISNEFRDGARTIVWLANSEELCEQAAQEFEAAWGFLGNRPINTIRFFGTELSSLDYNEGFIVAGLAKLYSAYKQQPTILAKVGMNADMIVFDEAHQALAETYHEMIAGLVSISTESFLLGLSATPGRTYDDISEDMKLSNMFGNNKLAMKVEGYSNPMMYLIDEGFLSRPSYHPIDYQGSLNNDDLLNIAKSLDVPYPVLKRLGNDTVRNLAIVTRVLSLAERHNRIIIFATSVEHSELIATVLAAKNIDVHSVTGNTPKDIRERAINHFKEASDDCRILCNFGVLTTGFDAPKTSCVVIARPTKSLVLYSQMVGRAMRGTKVGGTPECEVWTVTDLHIPGFRDVTEAIHNWEDVWITDMK